MGVGFDNFTVSVVIPALNEAPNVRGVLLRMPPDVHEVILVDGLSKDGTIEVARSTMPSIRVIPQRGRGKGAALREGFEAATGDIIVHLDADGSTDPGEIPAFVGALLAGADYAKGSRFIQGAETSDMTALHSVGNKFFVKLANLLFHTHFTDITYGYNALWRHHRDKLALEIDGWPNEIIGNIRAARHGLRVVEVASREWPRFAGSPKLHTFSAGWSILLAMLAERLRPLPTLSGQPRPIAPPTWMTDNAPPLPSSRPAQLQLMADQTFSTGRERPRRRAQVGVAVTLPIVAEAIAMPIDGTSGGDRSALGRGRQAGLGSTRVRLMSDADSLRDPSDLVEVSR